MEYKIVNYQTQNGQRYAIADEDDKVIDDAQGYGYKSFINAKKAANYKFNGGKKKADDKKALYHQWIKDNNGKAIVRFIDDCIMQNFKDADMITNKAIKEAVKTEFGVELPDYFLSVFHKR